MRLAAVILAIGIWTTPHADAAGNHFGYCNGVGNPHQGSNCGSPPSATSGLTPTQVPTATQLPTAVSGPKPTTSGQPAVITITPNPPGTFTGYGPVIPPQGATGPGITGSDPLPITVIPVQPPVVTGYGPITVPQAIAPPSFTGTGQQLVTIVPLPPQVLTGTTPTTPGTAVPGAGFTGVGLPTITIIPTPPTTFTGVGPVPTSIIVQPAPGFSGYGAIPYPTPQAKPIAVPTPVAHPIPQPTPQKVPQSTTILVKRPKPRPQRTVVSSTSGGKISHGRTQGGAALGPGHVTVRTGRQAQHDAPKFAAKDGGRAWRCVASGHGKRRTVVDRELTATGALRHVGAVDVLGRDLPALHPEHANCIISVRRRKD